MVVQTVKFSLLIHKILENAIKERNEYAGMFHANRQTKRWALVM